jgi:hypothetical protein
MRNSLKELLADLLAVADQMGKTKGLYNAEYPEGVTVQIVDRLQLGEFMATWRYHHPLTNEQLGYGGLTARVKSVSFYHGGDELYVLEGVPGLWHEACLGPGLESQN